MAITRAQQIRQMLEDGGMLVKPSTTGKRPGYRGIGGYQEGRSAPSSGGSKSGGPTGAGGQSPGPGGGEGKGGRGGTPDGGSKSGGNGEPKGRDPSAQFKGLPAGYKTSKTAKAALEAQRAGFKENLGSSKGGDGGGGLKDLFGKTIFGRVLTGISNSKLAQMNNLMQRQNYLSYLSRTNPQAFLDLTKSLEDQDLATIDESSVANPNKRVGANAFSVKDYIDLNPEKAGSPDVKDAFGEGYQTYLDRFNIPENKQGGDNTGTAQVTPLWAQLGFNSEAAYLASLNPATTTPTPSTRNFGGLAPRFAGSIFDFTGMAEGGRAGFQTGGSSGVSMQNTLAQNIAANNAQAIANQKARGAISALLSSKISNTSPATTTASMPSPSSMASTPSPSPMASTSSSSSQMTPSSTPSSGTGGFTVNTPTGTTTFNSPGNFGVQGVMIDGKIYYSEQEAIDDLGIVRYNQLMADGGRAGYMDGGMTEEDDPVGGIMDLESGRQMYFLGKLVKKATRAVKKVVKSPVGKAALLYGLGSLGASALGKYNAGTGSGFFSGLKGKLFGQAALGAKKVPGMGSLFKPATEGILGKLGITKGGGSFMPTLGGGITLGLGVPALMDLFGVGKEKEEDDFDVDEYYRTQGIDIDAIRNSPYRFLAPRMVGSRFEQADGGRTGYQEGGDAEPVAKKTMPLLEMDGKEKDYRETGGFVDMGRMERADDVPARLSKNEFVFTADAVRNAGEGNIDKGAEVMYNMMKNLESGGEVSEESQGLDGAREMFKTSQRLEEVL